MQIDCDKQWSYKYSQWSYKYSRYLFLMQIDCDKQWSHNYSRLTVIQILLRYCLFFVTNLKRHDCQLHISTNRKCYFRIQECLLKDSCNCAFYEFRQEALIGKYSITEMYKRKFKTNVYQKVDITLYFNG